uniref:Cdkn1a interacting zinc finger protein 1a n=1 Tax=Poecilia formosa TaxID=48698 RepID=A0A096M0W6_POEFO
SDVQPTHPPPPPPAQPPPAHHVGHHHQTPRTIPVPTQTAPPPRMVNLCQTTQTTLIAPNPMLQSAILMQQMQGAGNMRGFGMGGQQFRQFFTAGARSSLLGPVPMGMAIKSPIMGFPAARAFHPHTRFFNATASSSSSSSSTSATVITKESFLNVSVSVKLLIYECREQQGWHFNVFHNKENAKLIVTKFRQNGAVGGENSQTSEEQLEEPVSKRQKTEGRSEEPKEQHVTESVTTAQSESNSNTVDTQSEGCVIQEDECFSGGPDDVAIEENKADNDEEEASEGSNKFYCYLCSITCFNQQNFRSHMNSISHQQRMMEIQHMSNACLVTLLPRVQESLQGASKDGEKKADLKQWCGTCHTHFTSSISDHHRSEEHKLASKTDLSFCAVCQKRFKTSQNFIEHLHSQEHKQKAYQIKEKGCETLTKLTNMGTDGFSCELEAQELEKNEGDQGSSEDGWPSAKEVALNDMTSDEQYDPDTIYGSSFLDPVAGFLCRLCNKFYLFESSALHSHCKSLQHFENLKSYKAMVGEKGED